jgi:hypothetical protein
MRTGGLQVAAVSWKRIYVFRGSSTSASLFSALLCSRQLRIELSENPIFQEPYQLTHPMLVESAKSLPATKSTSHFMFNPRSLSSGKPIVRLHRTQSLIVLYFRNVEYGVFKVLRQSCID